MAAAKQPPGRTNRVVGCASNYFSSINISVFSFQDRMDRNGDRDGNRGGYDYRVSFSSFCLCLFLLRFLRENYLLKS